MNMRCCYSQFEMPWDLFFCFFLSHDFFFRLLPLLCHSSSHEYRMKRQQTPKWNHFRSYFGNTDIHKQINPKKEQMNNHFFGHFCCCRFSAFLLVFFFFTHFTECAPRWDKHIFDDFVDAFDHIPNKCSQIWSLQ